MLITHGGREAAAMGRRLRELHKSIKGTDPDGSSYHALEPEAYAWVHATLFQAGIVAHERFIGPLTDAQVAQLYREYMPLGRLLGIRESDIPTTYGEFRGYFDAMVADRLERNETVDRVIRSFTMPGPPLQLPAPVERLWSLLRIAPAQAVKVSSFGLLPPVLRARFGLEWGALMETELRAMGAASRALSPVMPASLRNTGPS
jgi:uncharacterized protein (DUF2236 family)